MNTNGLLSDDEAEALVADSNFLWHQAFHLSDIVAPGANDIEWLLNRVGLPFTLKGATLIDIGTTNGGGAFIAQQRGAKKVVAVDIYGPERFGFDRLNAAFGAGVDFVQGTIYELPQILGDEQFDEVLFLGVLCHLRHPLLALDSLRRLTRKPPIWRLRSGAILQIPQWPDIFAATNSQAIVRTGSRRTCLVSSTGWNPRVSSSIKFSIGPRMIQCEHVSPHIPRRIHQSTSTLATRSH